VSGVMRWEEPPRRRAPGEGRDWAVIAADLKAHAGEWAVIAVCANQALAATTAHHVRLSVYIALVGDRYEAKARTVDGEFRVYARFVGETPP
jgi:hypothetical protein